jgi:hypothetical protein
MKWLHIVVEGQTEETFVGEVLKPHLFSRGIYPVATLVTTRLVDLGPNFKGGITSYSKTRRHISRLLNDRGASAVTTMLDFYGLPADFPGRTHLPTGSGRTRVAYLEAQLQSEIDNPKFIPYLALHEFESMIFVAPEYLARLFPGINAQALLKIKEQFSSPEEINDDPQTAPSKRLQAIIAGYQKPLHGPLVTRDIGLDRIRKECSHFDEWLRKLEALGE